LKKKKKKKRCGKKKRKTWYSRKHAAVETVTVIQALTRRNTIPLIFFSQAERKS
jgi:hypothetical protein